MDEKEIKLRCIEAAAKTPHGPPERAGRGVKDDGRAEAALIALWGERFGR